uniref:Uncharacterized protein n=1 Tax=uncultured prokaryote TaxID=198431 RepID=A0A0H5PX46_9ZZZZ|nr:hypothetical protein [uncultured prokaryote]
MRKHAIECATALLKWTADYAGEQCTHVFTDVIVRGGPKITYETISSSQRRCEGRLFVTTEKRNSYNWIERADYVHAKRMYEAKIERIRVICKCPVCGQKVASNWFDGEPEEVKHVDQGNDDSVPF